MESSDEDAVMPMSPQLETGAGFTSAPTAVPRFAPVLCTNGPFASHSSEPSSSKRLGNNTTNNSSTSPFRGERRGVPGDSVSFLDTSVTERPAVIGHGGVNICTVLEDDAGKAAGSGKRVSVHRHGHRPRTPFGMTRATAGETQWRPSHQQTIPATVVSVGKHAAADADDNDAAEAAADDASTAGQRKAAPSASPVVMLRNNFSIDAPNRPAAVPLGDTKSHAGVAEEDDGVSGEEESDEGRRSGRGARLCESPSMELGSGRNSGFIVYSAASSVSGPEYLATHQSSNSRRQHHTVLPNPVMTASPSMCKAGVAGETAVMKDAHLPMPVGIFSDNDDVMEDDFVDNDDVVRVEGTHVGGGSASQTSSAAPVEFIGSEM